MRGPNPRLLIMLMSFICGTVAAAAAKPLGTPVQVVIGLIGAGLGWSFARSIARKLF